MKNHSREVNRNMLIAWGVIVLVLIGSYLGEVFKGERTLTYFLIFVLITALPYLFCVLLHGQKKELKYFSVIMVCCYFVMYAFVLLTGSTTMVFSYILPLLSFLVLFHQPKLVLGLGAASLLVNLASIGLRVRSGEVVISNSKDVEIQLALIVLCFGGAWISSKMYQKITRDNQAYVEQLLAQAEQISNQEGQIKNLSENVEVVSQEARMDVLTGLSNRLAFEELFEQIKDDSEMNYGVIYCDVNGLKLKNDNEGHDVGDQLLRTFAAMLKKQFREKDCYRISGDEFLVLMNRIDQDIFDVRAERFHSSCWTQTPPISSVGWYYGTDVEECIKNAEAKMYKDKKEFYQAYPAFRR